MQERSQTQTSRDPQLIGYKSVRVPARTWSCRETMLCFKKKTRAVNLSSNPSDMRTSGAAEKQEAAKATVIHRDVQDHRRESIAVAACVSCA